MGKTPFFRRKLLVDKKLQLGLFGLCFFLSLIWICFGSLLFIVWLIRNPGDWDAPRVRLLLFILGCASFLFSLLLTLLMTNRIAGPIYRLRLEMRRVSQGEKPRLITVRKKDLLGDLYTEYNSLLQHFDKSLANREPPQKQ